MSVYLLLPICAAEMLVGNSWDKWNRPQKEETAEHTLICPLLVMGNAPKTPRGAEGCM
jgi:hypothetical protein